MKRERLATIGGIFLTGYLVGQFTMASSVNKTLQNRKELVARGLVSAFTKARQENWTPEKLNEALHKELQFIQIVSR